MRISDWRSDVCSSDLIAETEYHGEVEAITAPFKGLALGVFLISVGMGLNLATIARNWTALVIAVVGVVAVKTIVTAALLRFSGSARRSTAAEVGLLMSSPSETTLIVLATAFQAQLISRATAEFWQLVTAIGLTITPLLARIGHDVARRIEMGNSEVEAEEAPPRRTVVVGFGRVGRVVAELLREHDRPYIAVDADIDTVAAATPEFGQPVTRIGLDNPRRRARGGDGGAGRIEVGNSEVEAEEAPPRRTVVVGFGRVGRVVAELLREHDRPYIAVDADIDTVAAARRDGFNVRYTDVGRPGSLAKIGRAHV